QRRDEGIVLRIRPYRDAQLRLHAPARRLEAPHEDAALQERCVDRVRRPRRLYPEKVRRARRDTEAVDLLDSARQGVARRDHARDVALDTVPSLLEDGGRGGLARSADIERLAHLVDLADEIPIRLEPPHAERRKPQLAQRAEDADVRELVAPAAERRPG